MKIKRVLILFCIIFVISNSCYNNNEVNKTVFLSIQEIKSPAAAGSGEANLFTAEDSRIFLSWIEPGGDTRNSLRFAVCEERNWSQPNTIVEDNNLFVNWADFPSLVVLGDGSLAAHWLKKSADAPYAYDVNIAFSTDGGKIWLKAITPHCDNTQTEHGFVSMLPWTNDQLFVVWLDGRNFSKEGIANKEQLSSSDEMTLRFAIVDKNGKLYDETVLDHRVCECCQTSIARTANSVVVVYRDRSEEEIRDISLLRFSNGHWSKPRTLYEDDWKITGCPVSGPAIAALGQLVAVAWFTAAEDTPRVKIIFSSNEGINFGEPITVDDGKPIGRVDLVLLPDNTALVSWIELTKKGGEIRVRSVHQNGSRGQSITLTESGTERASGFPRMVHYKNEIYFAWTQPGNPSTVRTAVAKLNGY